MKKIFCFIILFIFNIALLKAQISTAGISNAEGLKSTVYGLGFAAGWSSGVGISFRAHLPSNSSVQGIFGIIKTSNKLAMSIGGEYQYDLVRNNSLRFYGASSIAYFYNGSDRNEVAGPFRVGFGVGCEFLIKDSFHVSAGAMFVFFSDGRVIPLPQIAAHFYFN